MDEPSSKEYAVSFWAPTIDCGGWWAQLLANYYLLHDINYYLLYLNLPFHLWWEVFNSIFSPTIFLNLFCHFMPCLMNEAFSFEVFLQTLTESSLSIYVPLDWASTMNVSEVTFKGFNVKLLYKTGTILGAIRPWKN